MMKIVVVYDRALCCATGVCGPQVDPVLPRFASDLEWLQLQGIQVRRHNLAQNPADFVANEAVRAILAKDGADCLPVVFVDGVEVSRKEYPSREQLASWTNTDLAPTTNKPAAEKKNLLPIAVSLGPCCGSNDCC